VCGGGKVGGVRKEQEKRVQGVKIRHNNVGPYSLSVLNGPMLQIQNMRGRGRGGGGSFQTSVRVSS
jgi:hypothetical protein